MSNRHDSASFRVYPRLNEIRAERHSGCGLAAPRFFFFNAESAEVQRVAEAKSFWRVYEGFADDTCRDSRNVTP